ncbi:MAG: type II toxin-antitoxin system RelE/ParE family toxin [Thermoanaerobaculia bacterium]|nr:type II toxin-antitoxin system RelE/ParE family toxin [Thermoanaerobaculia bacterium]
MGSFEIEWKRSATRELRNLAPDARRRILAAVQSLAANPRPHGSRKLVGAENSWRVRIGDYRVVYSIFEAALIIEIVRVGHRREVYRDLG